MTVERARELEGGEKVIYEGTVYDFAYKSAFHSTVVLYIEGCKNMQDSIAVDAEKVTVIKDV